MTEQQPDQNDRAGETGVAPETDRDIGTDPKHPHPQDRPVDEDDQHAEDDGRSDDGPEPNESASAPQD